MPRDLSPIRGPHRLGWRTFFDVMLGCLIAPVVSYAGEDPEISFRREPGRLRIEVRGELIATYVYLDETIPRPYFADVHAPGGIRVTRNHPPVQGVDPTDHATFHPGLWLAFGDLSGADDWRNRARVEHERFVEEPAGGGGGVAFAVANRYLAEGGATICREICRYRILARPSGYLLMAASEFSSNSGDFTFGDQEEMGFGVRVATPLSVKKGGRLRNSDNLEGEREVWGETALWCDYSGTIAGRHVGIALLPDPKNFRRSWFHARDTGLLVANPFGNEAFTKGEKSRVIVRRGETFRLGFGALFHASPAGKEPDLAAAYGDYVEQLVNQAPSPSPPPRVLSAVDDTRRMTPLDVVTSEHREGWSRQSRLGGEAPSSFPTGPSSARPGGTFDVVSRRAGPLTSTVRGILLCLAFGRALPSPASARRKHATGCPTCSRSLGSGPGS